jgi:raffinose/stachyose/melibiose transport system permease protein
MTTTTTTATQFEQSAEVLRPARRRRRSADQDDTRRTNWWATALIAVCSLTILIPLYLAVVVALKTPAQLTEGTGFEWPNPVNWGNFAQAWERTSFPQALMNTALITVGSVAFTLLTSSIVAYAIARNIHRPFFKGVFFYLLAALFIPFPIIMLPLVKQTALLGLDNQAGLIILYTVYGLSLNIFIYTAYIRSIPIELEEAARIDGASTWRVFWSILVPLSRPIAVALMVLVLIYAWNSYLLPKVFLIDDGMGVVTQLPEFFRRQYNDDTPKILAASVITAIPTIIAYIALQRQFERGMAAGAIK